MATRTHAREAVVGFLYAFDVGNEGIEKFINDILEERKIRNAQKNFALDLFYGIVQRKEILDFMIIQQLKEWDFERIGAMERAILRLGVYEILFLKTDVGVVINEGIELSKSFGGEQTPRFINGILDAIAKGERDLDKIAVSLNQHKKMPKNKPKKPHIQKHKKDHTKTTKNPKDITILKNIK